MSQLSCHILFENGGKRQLHTNKQKNQTYMMTESQLHTSYILAQKYYHKKLSTKEVRALAAKEGISENSQSNYFCAAYRNLINGTKFTGQLSAYIWEYYLSRIFAEFSDDIRCKALKCFMQAIEYSEEKNKANAVTLRRIYSRYSSQPISGSIVN